MSIKEWLRKLVLGPPKPDQESERVSLDSQQNQIAGRLSKMTGTTRDEVLSEAYRRARLTKEAQSFRPRQ